MYHISAILLSGLTPQRYMCPVWLDILRVLCAHVQTFTAILWPHSPPWHMNLKPPLICKPQPCNPDLWKLWQSACLTNRSKMEQPPPSYDDVLKNQYWQQRGSMCNDIFITNAADRVDKKPVMATCHSLPRPPWSQDFVNILRLWQWRLCYIAHSIHC